MARILPSQIRVENSSNAGSDFSHGGSAIIRDSEVAGEMAELYLEQGQFLIGADVPNGISAVTFSEDLTALDTTTQPLIGDWLSGSNISVVIPNDRVNYNQMNDIAAAKAARYPIKT